MSRQEHASVWLVGLAFVATLCPAVPAARTGELESARAARRSPVVRVFQATRDAVVNISSTQIHEVRRSIFGFDELFDEIFQSPFTRRFRYRVQSVGSGFVVHRDGYIITNAHVVSRTGNQKIIFADKSEYEARIIAIDHQHDLAVLKIDAGRPLPHLKLGHSDDLMVGETVIAIGNPFGYQHTVTAGIISALNRELRFSQDVVYRGLIQTDAAINPGNSGGPLLNVLGELIGINTAIRGDAQNMGFAIAVDQLRALLPNMLSLEQLRRLQLGLRVRGRSEPRVVELVADSPAERAGIRIGDVLRSIDGTAIDDEVDFYFEMLSKTADQPVRFTLLRDGRQVELSVRLRPLPKPDGAALARRRLGLELRELGPDQARRLGLQLRGVLLVAGLEAGGPAARLGARRGDILWQVGRFRISSLDEVGQVLSAVRSGDLLYLGFVRISGVAVYQFGGQVEAR